MAGTIVDNASLIFANPLSQTFAPTISGTGNVTKSGTATLTLSGFSTYTGTTYLNSGILNAGSAYALGDVGPVTFGGGILQYSAASAGIDFSGRIVNSGSAIILDTNGQNVGIITGFGASDTGGLVKNGTGMLGLGGTNNFTGGITINGGTLQLGSSTAISAANGPMVINSGTVNLNSYSLSIGALSGSAGTAISMTTSGAPNITINSSANGTFGGVIYNSSGNLTLTKQGTGVETFTGANLFGNSASTTTISGGELALGPGGSLSSSNAITVQTSGTFGVIQTTNGATNSIDTIQLNTSATAGAAFTMADGYTTTLNVAATSVLSSGALANAPTMAFDIGGATGTNSDLLAISGSATIGTKGDVISFNDAGTKVLSGTYTFITATGGLGAATLTLASNRITANDMIYYLSLAPSTTTAESVTITASGAQSLYWTGGLSTSGSVWNTITSGSTNWDSDAGSGINMAVTPNYFTDVYFSATNPVAQNLTNTLGVSTTINSLNFISASAVTTATDGSTLTIGSTNAGTSSLNGITVASGAGAETINVPITLGTAQSWTNNSANLLTVGGNVTNGGYLLTVNGTGGETISGNITGAGGLTDANSGILTLSGSNSYTGNTKINAGTLALSSAYALPSTTGTISFGGGTLQYSSLNNTDYSGLIKSSTSAISIDTNGQTITWGTGQALLPNTDTGGLTKLGAGTLILQGTDSFTGQMTVTSGTLKLQVTGYGLNTAANPLSVGTGGTFDYNNLQGWVGALSGSGTIINGSEMLVGPTSGSGWASTFAGTIANTQLDVRAVLANLTLSGSVGLLNGSSFGVGVTAPNASTINITGTTTVGSSVLYVGDQGSTNVVVNGGLLQVLKVGTPVIYVGYNTSQGTVSMYGNLTLNSGTISVTSVESDFTATSTVPTATVPNGYVTGTSNILLNGGVLSTSTIYNKGTVAASPMTLTINGGAINASAAGTLFADGGHNNELSVEIGSGATINTEGFAMVSQRPLMNVSGSSTAGALTVTGGGSLNLSGSGSFTGTTLINGGATVRISNDYDLGAAPGSAVANQVEINGGTLNFSSCLNGISLTAFSSGSSTTIGTIAASGVTGAAIKADNSIESLTGGVGGSSLVSGSVTVTVALPDIPGGIQATASVTLSGGTISGYTITNPGSGYSVAPAIYLRASTGTLPTTNPTVGYYALSGSVPVIESEGIVTGPVTLTFAGLTGTATATTTSSMSLAANRGIQIDGSGGDLDVSNSPAGFTATVNGPISGSGALTKSSGGELVLTASNSYQGGTIITGGTLQTVNAYGLGSVPASLAVNVGTLDVDGNSLAVTTLSGSSGGLITTSANGNPLLTVNGTGSSTYNGVIQNGSGQFGLTKSGTGTLNLGGVNTYTGNTLINGGVLGVSVSGALNANTNITFGGGTLKYIGNTTDYSSQIVNSGSAVSIDTGNVGPEFYTPLAASNSGGLTVLSSSGNGTLTVISPQVYTGPTTITSGALYLGDNTGGDDVSSMATSGILDNALLEFRNVGTDTNTTAISGTGTVEMYGTGVEIFSGSNSYSGGTLVNSGVLNYTNANALGTGPVTFVGSGILQAGAGVSGTLPSMGANAGVTGTFDTQGNAETLISLTGAGTVAKVGAGTLSITGSSNDTGVFAINGGMVALANANALPTATGTISFGGGTLQYSLVNAADYSSRIANSTGAISIDTNGQNVTFASALPSSNTGGFTKNGAGTLSLNGVDSYTGATTINSGTLQVGNNSALGNSSNSLVMNGGTLNVTNYNASLANLSGNSGTIVNTGTGTFTFTTSGTSTFAGAFNYAGNSPAIWITGNGTLTLSGSSLLSGSSSTALLESPNGSTATIIIPAGASLTANTVPSQNGNNMIALQTGNLIVNGGSVSTDARLAAGWSATVGGIGSVTINSGTVTALAVTHQRTGYGNINLNGGVLGTTYIYNYQPFSETVDAANNSVDTLTLAFNGGVLRATGNSTAGAALVDNGFNVGETELSVTTGTGNAFIDPNGFNATIRRPISGSGSIAVGGAGEVPGTVSLAYPGNGYGGGTIVNSGTLVVDYSQIATGASGTPANILPSTTAVTLADGAALSVLGRPNGGTSSATWTTGTNGSGQFSNEIFSSGNTTGLAVGEKVSGANIIPGTYIEAIVSPGTIVLSNTSTSPADGSGVMTFTPNSSLVNETIGSVNLASGTSTININNNGGTSTALTVTGGVTGSGGLQETGNGVLVLNGSGSYSGGTTINGGTLQAANANALGASTGNLAVNAGTLDMDGNSITVGALSSGSGGVITTTAGGTIALTSSSASNTTFAGSIQSGAGTLGLTQAGTGSLKLTGNSTYTGPTVVNAGTLIVSGSLSGTGSASVASGGTLEVDGLLNHSATATLNGGTLQGTGSVGGITDNGSSTLAPGMTVANSGISTGTMTAAGSVMLAATTDFNIRLGLSASGTDADQLAATGGNNVVSLNGANLQLTLGTAVNNPALINTYYLIINGGASGTGVGNNIFAGLAQGTSFNVSNGFTFTIDYASTFLGSNSAPTVGGGDDVVVELTAIPEPGTWATMLSGFGMLIFVQRMRRKARH